MNKKALEELEEHIKTGDNMMGVLRKATPEVRGYYRKWLLRCKELVEEVKGDKDEQSS